jgi:uncharacterized membrane protein
MTKYLVSAAAAAIVAVSAFSAPASAQSFSVGVNAGHDRPYYGGGYRGDGYRGDGYRSGPGVTIRTGRSSYRECYTKQTVKYRNGRKIITERQICD